MKAKLVPCTIGSRAQRGPPSVGRLTLDDPERRLADQTLGGVIQPHPAPARSRQHIVLGNALMGLRYLQRRGGMGYFPAYMAAEALAAGSLHAVEGAPDISLGCRALYLPDNPALEHIRQVVRGLQEVRGG